MEDPLERNPLLEVGPALEGVEAQAKAIAEALAGVDLSAAAESLQAQYLAVKRALPSCEDFWVDLWAFSITALPWGLGLTHPEFLDLAPREWLALYRVWEYHDNKRAANSIQVGTVPPTKGDNPSLASNESGVKGADGGSEPRSEETIPEPQFPKRASWLKDRLQERSWNKHDVSRYRGPDSKTVEKILRGQKVREDVLEKLAAALSNVPASKRLPNVMLLDIPQD